MGGGSAIAAQAVAAVIRAAADLDLPPLDAHFEANREGHAGTARDLNTAFLLTLAGPGNASFLGARSFLDAMAGSARWAAPAGFYDEATHRMPEEIQLAAGADLEWAAQLSSLARRHEPTPVGWHAARRLWPVFFPEGVSAGNDARAVSELRAMRVIGDLQPNPLPLTDPARQVLFTANVLLGPPLTRDDPDRLDVPATLRDECAAAGMDSQRQWYDHPIPLGVPPAHNEILHGLRGLDEAVAFERRLGRVANRRVVCVLSVSATHDSVQRIASAYLDHVFAQSGGMAHLDVYAFTEADTTAFVHEVLAPVADRCEPAEGGVEAIERVFGVDGAYGRHYSFLKAIAAVWHVLIDPAVTATFKIDLDQVFPQEALLRETGATAFQRLTTPLWGATGVDARGAPVELGMIAGTLVNAGDMERSLFTPDVSFPERPPAADELAFWSRLPQALSTASEMTTRYGVSGPDGVSTCLERIHVTGGVTGILVDTLRRRRPFTPTFVGRAEDQAYVMSTFVADCPRVTHAHVDGLVMRHDKEVFARDAMARARTGKLVGDYERMLVFSAYARALTDDISAIKKVLDPFTGSFVSRVPFTVAALRLSLKTGSLFAAGDPEGGLEMVTDGTPRLARTAARTRGHTIAETLAAERSGWDLFYTLLDRLEEDLAEGAAYAVELRAKAKAIVTRCNLRRRACG